MGLLSVFVESSSIVGQDERMECLTGFRVSARIVAVASTRRGKRAD
jgi:hypothetical protein